MRNTRLSWLQPNARWRSMQVENRHAAHEFILVVHGRYRIRRAGGEEEGGPGSAFFIPARQEHHGILTYDGSLQFVALQFDAGTIWTGDLVPQVEDRLGRLFAVVTWLRTYGYEPGPADRAAVDRLGGVFVDEYRRLGRSPSGDADLVAQARAYMERGLATNFGIGDICAALDVGSSTLHRAFVAATGRPPMAHLKEVRAQAALHLVRESRLPLDEVAGRVGLQHGQSVARLLKQVYGKGVRELR